MNIAILDDSKEDLRQVKSVISSYYESQNTSADIHLYSSAEAFFTKYIPGFYDLIIMDIYMGSMTGMDAARKLREARDTAALIFISSSDSFAVASYDVQASYYLLKPFDPERPELSTAVTDEVEIQIKYAGYLTRQEKQVEEFRKEEARLLPENLDYAAIPGLRLEAREKLAAIRPVSIGQAGRISGVSPADIAVLLIYLEQTNG